MSFLLLSSPESVIHCPCNQCGLTRSKTESFPAFIFPRISEERHSLVPKILSKFVILFSLKMTFKNLRFLYFQQHGIEVKKCGREEKRNGEGGKGKTQY
jgi:hypothetical protein